MFIKNKSLAKNHEPGEGGAPMIQAYEIRAVNENTAGRERPALANLECY
jgi:hypothetical protein